MNLINNKVKQFAAGNWGSNKFIKKETRIPDPLQPEETQYRSRKKRTDKVDWEARYHGCPFCLNKLPIIEKNPKYLWGEKRATMCECGAVERANECPACHRNIWYKNGWYRHGGVFRRLGCGFYGQKLIRAICVPLDQGLEPRPAQPFADN